MTIEPATFRLVAQWLNKLLLSMKFLILYFAKPYRSNAVIVRDHSVMFVHG